jgi:hypothetical protein
LGWGLGRVTSGSIIQMDLHKQNNKLVSALWCIDEPHPYMDSQDLSQP